MKGYLCSKRGIYHNLGIDKNNMGQMHSKKNVYQRKCSNAEDYDIVYGSTQMCAYGVANWVSNMDDRKSTSSFFFYWEIMLSVGIVRNKPLLLCHQQKLNIWQFHK